MADYPHYNTIPQSDKSRRTPIGLGNIVSIAEDGSIRARNFQAVQPYRFDLMHEHIPIADAVTITTHYQTEAATSFNFVWAHDNATYICKYEGVEPTVEPVPGAGNSIAHVLVVLVGTKV